MSNQPISEQYRIAALEWVDLDNAARLLEETKDVQLAQLVQATGEDTVARGEKVVKASEDWNNFIHMKVEARTKANKAKCKLEFIRMRFSEQQSFEASRRAEMKL